MNKHIVLLLFTLGLLAFSSASVSAWYGGWYGYHPYYGSGYDYFPGWFYRGASPGMQYDILSYSQSESMMDFQRNNLGQMYSFIDRGTIDPWGVGIYG